MNNCYLSDFVVCVCARVRVPMCVWFGPLERLLRGVWATACVVTTSSIQLTCHTELNWYTLKHRICSVCDALLIEGTTFFTMDYAIYMTTIAISKDKCVSVSGGGRQDVIAFISELA